MINEKVVPVDFGFGIVEVVIRWGPDLMDNQKISVSAGSAIGSPVELLNFSFDTNYDSEMEMTATVRSEAS